MTPSRSFAMSAGIHALFLAVLIPLVMRDGNVEKVIETLNIRIVEGVSSGERRAGRASSPAEVEKERKVIPDTPAETGRLGGIIGDVPTGPERTARNAVSADIGAGGPAAPDAASVLAGLSSPDPLSGMEMPEADGSDKASGDSGLWSLRWENGDERGIFSFPGFNPEDVPESSERLMDVNMAITVSARGDVLSVEVLPPGSGDIRVDRFVHSLAMQLVMEPALTGDGVQEAVLRLVFAGGGR